MAEQRLIVVNGVRYHADRPLDCALCAFWKNRKTGCILGEANCYYLAEAIVTEQEKKCEGCCYAKEAPVSAPAATRTWISG